MSSRQVSDPAPAVARLRAGGSIEAEARALAQPLIERGSTWGVAIGVATADGTTQTFGYGRAAHTALSPPPLTNTIFQIGSVSKLFVATVLAILVDEGALRYEDTVRSLLPPEIPLSASVGDVTLYELATHTAGFPREPLCRAQLWNFGEFLLTGHNLYRYIDQAFLYDYLAHVRLPPKSQRNYQYSSIGYGLLAHLIERKTGRSFGALLEEKVCRPLGLRDTTLALNAEQEQRLAVGHVGTQPKFMRRGLPLPPWDMGEIMRPSGSMYSTVNDLLVFAQASLGLRHPPLEPVLASLQRVHWKRSEEGVGLGWLYNEVGEAHTPIVYKHGMVSGYHAYLGFSPQARIAVVVLCNTFSWHDEVGHNLVLRLAHGLAPPLIAQPPRPGSVLNGNLRLSQ